MDWPAVAATGLGSAWLSGVNLYATVMTLGLHSFIRIPAGAVLATSAFADFDGPVRIAALLLGGGLALGAHGSKAATRVAVNATAPGAGIALSLVEDVAAFGSTLLMVFFPLVFLALLGLAILATAWLAPRVVRALRGAPRPRDTPVT